MKKPGPTPRPRYSQRRRRWVACLGPPDKQGRAREMAAPRRIGPADERGAWEWLLVASADALDDDRWGKLLAEKEARFPPVAAPPPEPEPATIEAPPAEAPPARGGGDRGVCDANTPKGRVVMALMGLPPAVGLPELAEAMGVPAAEVAATVGAMTARRVLETWPDERRPGVRMVMMSAGLLDRLGLARLARRPALGRSCEGAASRPESDGPARARHAVAGAMKIRAPVPPRPGAPPSHHEYLAGQS